MKKISELDISPWPWEICDFCAGNIGVSSSSGRRVADASTTGNARLIAAAPELYECLREAVVEFCHNCEDQKIENCRGKCFVAKWRDALAKASGESEENK